jgi:hypothetical protein
MKDQRLVKIRQHYSICLDGVEFKILTHTINEEKGILRIKTKIKGQSFPRHDHVLVAAENMPELTVAFRHMYSDEKIEHWEYVFPVDYTTAEGQYRQGDAI